MEFEIIYQCQDFVVINKPFGVSVHKDQQQIGLTQQLAKQLNVAQVWLVHRLDQGTSGLLILALNQQSASQLSRLFAEHRIEKTYLAIATHKPKKKQGLIIGDMQKSRNGSWKLCQSRENPAITRFYSISYKPNFRIFVLFPQTGKTHQLRVAMKSLGSPILGDTRYGEKPQDRLYLHCYRLQFEFNQQKFDLYSPLSEDSQKCGVFFSEFLLLEKLTDIAKIRETND